MENRDSGVQFQGRPSNDFQEPRTLSGYIPERGSGQRKAPGCWEARILGQSTLAEWRVSTWKPYSGSLVNKTEAYGSSAGYREEEEPQGCLGAQGSRRKHCFLAHALGAQDCSWATMSDTRAQDQSGTKSTEEEVGCGSQGSWGMNKLGKDRDLCRCPQLSSKTWNGRRASGKLFFRNPLLFAPEEAKPTCKRQQFENRPCAFLPWAP